MVVLDAVIVHRVAAALPLAEGPVTIHRGETIAVIVITTVTTAITIDAIVAVTVDRTDVTGTTTADRNVQGPRTIVT